ncbi:MAG TPA: tetratricopeptide repeat protein [Urbifossiella sp.]|jgi:tetratricopeptide (TPR) repeat protein|nr:tetratricopeptide repeat protein [Urbifossiella sp.]
MRRRKRVIIGVAIFFTVVVVVGWWQWRRPATTPRVPPEVVVEDPVVAEAVARSRADITARPNDPDAWGRMGETLLANGMMDPARECLAEAGRLDPGNRRWPYLEGISLLLRDPVAALPLWRRAAECPGDDDRAIAARLRWAEALLEEDRATEAEPILRGVLSRTPENTQAHFVLGLLLAARGDTPTAVNHLLRCVDHPAVRKKTAGRLAALYPTLNRPVEAAEAARRESQLPPDADWPDPFREDLLPLIVGRDGLFLQAEKQQQLGNIPQAVYLYQQVIRRYPDEARAYAKLGMIVAEAGDYPAAEAVLRSGLRVAPDLVQGHYFLAVALFHQAERVGPSSPAGQAQFREAAVEARKATELKPDHGFAFLYLGLALKALGQRADATTALRAAARCTPEAVDPHLHLGWILAEDGNRREAIEELETAVRLAGPNDPRPRAALERTRSEPKAPSGKN